MSLKESITEDMKAAMRAKDSNRLSSIRMLQAAIQRKEVDERITLDDAQVTAVVEKLIKQGRDSIEQYTKGGREDLAAKEEKDLAVWQTYLPEPLGEEELQQLIADAIKEAGAETMKDMGKVMGILKPKIQGKADMGKVSGQIKAALNG